MSVINFLMSAGRAFSKWRRRENAYAELMALDDHSLADIGIHRSQIGALVDGMRVPDPPPRPMRLPTQEKFAQHRKA
jgi:uncharacterized protein YjiS (DUF1127 family)